MNSIEQGLTESEQRRLVELSEEATRNKAKAQQLALDAGKLLTATADRLEEYKDRGFFKRFWYAISGKQGELDRANQSDLISMQKFAYAYIMKLQEQNLVEAQAIAVIRNNLKELQEETGEIYDMISTIVKKFDARITRLENVTALHDWVIRISAHEHEFAKDKLAICFLQLVFDYLKVMREGRIPFESIENRDELTKALKDFGISANKEYSVEEFVSELFAEVGEFGFERFADITSLKIANSEIEPEFILDNVTGAGYNSIYHFRQKMSGMIDMAGRLSDRDAARKAMLESVLASLNNPATKYTLLELALEILGGSLIAEEVYAEENGITLHAVSQSEEAQPFDIGELLGDYMTISEHPFLTTNPSDTDKKIYLEAFALVYATVGYNDNPVYLKSMAGLFGQDESLNRIEWLSAHPKQIKPMMPQMIATLATDARKFAWCVDAIYLGYEKSGKDETGRLKDSIAQVCKFLKVKEDIANRLINGAEKLSVAQNAREFVAAMQLLSGLTDTWKPILEIKGLSLKGVFAPQRETLAAIIKESEDFGGLTVNGIVKLFSPALAITLEETAKIKCDRFLTKIRELMAELRPILSAFNADVAAYDKMIPQSIPQQQDLAIKCLAKIRQALKTISAQLEMYENGVFSENALRASSIQNATAQEIVSPDGGESRKLSFEFKKLERAPFDHSNIEAIECFESRWYALIKDKGIWSSSDAGETWQNVSFPGEVSLRDVNMHVAGDALVFWNASHVFAQRAGENEWFEVNSPCEDCGKKVEFIYKVADGWILQSSERTEYSYTEKGVLFDSQKTSAYNTAAFYKCSDLSENPNWEKIEDFCTREGFCIHPGCACFVEDGIVALSDRDVWYCTSRHESNAGPCFRYSLKGSGWKTADYPLESFQIKGRFGSVRSYFDLNARIASYNGVLLCCCMAGIFSSKDGRVWELVEKREFDIANYNSSVDMRCWRDIIIASVACENQLSCSLDGKVFSHIPIEPYPSLIAYGSDSILIVDKNDNAGGMFLGKIKYE